MDLGLDGLSDHGLSLGAMDSYIDDYVEGNDDLLETSSPKGNEEQTCGLCNQNYNDPLVLSCLHTFCRMCVENLMVDETGDNLKINKIVECPNCKQETKVADKGVALNSISCTFLVSNGCKVGGGDGVDDNPSALCTVCEGRDTSWSRCADCKTFLCANCIQAHIYSCTFSEKPREITPALCSAHASRANFFCFTCQSLICTTCSLMDHSTIDHRCERLGDAEMSVRLEIGNLITESKNKVQQYESTSTHLENGLSELQSQQDNAKDLINESFQSYKAILEKQRDERLEELKTMHAMHELKIMESFHNLEQTMEKLEDAWKFATKLLACGSVAEILSLKGAVASQLLHLINNAPKTEISTALEFETDIDKFQEAVEKTYGRFRSDSAVIKDTSQVASVAEAPPMGIVNSATDSSSPVSLPTSMQSSFDGDLGASYAMPRAVHATPPLSPPSLQNFTALQEYNIQQLAHLAVKEEVIQPVTPSAPSPTPSFTLADLFCGDAGSASNALSNLQALAQLGNVTLNEARQAVINGDSRLYLEAGQVAVNGDSRRFHTPSPSPPPIMPNTLSSLINDFTNGVHGVVPPLGSNLILGRGGGEMLEINTMQGGGYHGMNLSSLSGGSPSPNSDSDMMLNDSMLNLSNGTNAASYQFRGPAAGKLNSMQIRCKYGQLGPGKGQFNSPHGFCLGSEEDIIVADTNNHRIQVFDKAGSFKFQFGTAGKEEGQLWYPRKVAVMRNSGKFVVCDRGNERSRMQIFTKNGHFVKKIAIRYVDIVAGLAVTHQGHIVAVDSVSPTVFVISEAGELIRWFDCSDYMREPSDIAINGQEFFVCDFKGHCVVVFNEDGTFVRRIGAENITNFPNGIDISDAGDVLVGDSHGNRFHVAVFTREGRLLSEFECPYVKVSRCCGLKITSEGYVVTLAKNNHHVLVLNTLYIL